MGNKCCRGFARKKKHEIPQGRVVQDWEEFTVVSNDLIPTEMWENVLVLVKPSGKDLLSCRQVCRLWQNLADTMLEKQPIWSPQFPHMASIPLIFVGGFGEAVVRQIRGTKFTSASSLRKFLVEMEVEGKNPFPNRTVLLFTNQDLCVPSKRPRRGFYREIPPLFQRFGRHIWSMEYGVRDDTPGSVTNLTHFFDLTALKSLTIFARDWNTKRIRRRLAQTDKHISLRQDHGHRYLQELTELQILGCNGIIALNYIFARIGRQIENLYFCFVDDASSIMSDGTVSYMGPDDGFMPSEIDPSVRETLTYSLPVLTPNVKNLKVCEVSEEVIGMLFPSTGPRLTRLRQLSVKLECPFSKPLNRLMQAMDEHCADTLEVLHLEISRWPEPDPSETRDERERERAFDLNYEIKYPKLADVTLSYNIFLHEPDFIFLFAKKCINIKALTFVSVNIHIKAFPTLDQVCEPFWKKLPTTLEKVMMKHWNDKDDNGPNPPNTPAKKSSKHPKPPLDPVPIEQTCYRPKTVVPQMQMVRRK